MEPYANYTLRPEPGVTPDELYQFDRVDRLDKSHVIKLGMRNKLQTKREKGPHDLVDIDVFTFYDFDPDSGDDALETFYWDGELRPSRKVAVDFDGRYSLQEAELELFNTELSLREKGAYRASLEYRFRNERNSLLFGDLTLLPGAPWSYNIHARHEFENSRFEEGGGYVERALDCLVYRLGFSTLPGYTRTDGSEVDDEYRITLEFWLTAFPKIGLSGKHKQGG